MSIGDTFRFCLVGQAKRRTNRVLGFSAATGWKIARLSKHVSLYCHLQALLASSAGFLHLYNQRSSEVQFGNAKTLA